MCALCHKGLMPAIHLAVIVSNRQGLFSQDIRPRPMFGLVVPRLFCTDRHRHIQFANIMTKGYQVRSFRIIYRSPLVQVVEKAGIVPAAHKLAV